LSNLLIASNAIFGWFKVSVVAEGEGIDRISGRIESR